MELTELSLASKYFVVEKSNNSSTSESDQSNPSRKRKFSFDHHQYHHHHLMKSTNYEPTSVQTSVDLHVEDPLPLDWEQCLDLESGRMYYRNRKTSRKCWNWPKDHQKLDLELNISSTLLQNYPRHPVLDKGSNICKTTASSTGNMVALACLNCHLLVILSKSSPSCPNCKYVHSLPSLQSSHPRVVAPAKPHLDTLSLLN